jgi:D-tyrosyl-tRNA(Tyr) deacylase
MRIINVPVKAAEVKMRAVLQRAASAKVSIDGVTAGSIGRGMVVMLGVGREDGEAQAGLLAAKIASLRIFEDESGKMNQSLAEAAGGVLLISNFTLYADCRRGRRPDFTSAAPFSRAEELYKAFIAALASAGVEDVQTGRFGADMKVELVNDGPVTIILDTDDLR